VADDNDTAAPRAAEQQGDGQTAGATDDAERGSDSAACGAMRARTWTLAANYRAPADYDVPTLPDWTVIRSDDGGLVLADPDDETACIRADDPVRVRR